MLGIDTGGTYTDAVIFHDDQGILAKAKALTTRHDLSVGIAEALDKVLAQTSLDPRELGLVSLSTTLATNALVEGQGGRAALVMIGFGPEDLKRDGLAEALGSDPVVFLPGGHDVHGNEQPLDLEPLVAALPDLAKSVTSFAVAGYFAVRNPAHEVRVREVIRSVSGLPVTCSHELSSKLGGPRRALTTLLNARLVSMIDRLIGSAETYLAGRGVEAPLMVVRGDGALISASEARLRPIETILSGPAASLVGARHLTGLDNAIVSDIGGTTTDVAIMEDGSPRLDADGAVVGGYRTMVEAVAMRTFGLGGDSEVHIDDQGLGLRIQLGPRRLVPLSLTGTLHGTPVKETLERQLRASHAGRNDGRFAVRTGLPIALSTGLQPQEQALFDRIGNAPVPLDTLISLTQQKATLDRLVARGLVHICGLTPSDAMHLLNQQAQWDREAALLGMQLAARRKTGAGKPVAATPEELAQTIVDRLTRQSAEAILAATLAEDGLHDIDPARSTLISRALDHRPAITGFRLALDRPVVGLGASAPVYYPAIARALGSDLAIPGDADVANAIGAVVGQVRISVNAFITCPEEGLHVVTGLGEASRFTREQEAFAFARQTAMELAHKRAAANGAPDAVTLVTESVDVAEIEGRRQLIEARITATASGRPRHARA
ncbi:hydantoinase/oxoprolinase family protein [Peteryoungia desertarenae]|uniref:Hydantoinase/oxoprolinase family protein n=2 Tax=Peteryoungia desertarenae TaxID=1813451 RepID=A0ABX6QSW4_9HYPH|nr:hydantoinase/oxoprolinase family protein [Peteryoungia desertarenae]QLF71275.1 hydantoinase/oxoprolinase family protein [Peteryoungia desertarenae]